ncbi:MAG: GntR family transcriptional regulator [Butyricicoccus sp.]
MLRIDFRDSRPIYEQVADGIEDLAMHGAMQPDEQLPSVRQLAVELSINPNTIQRAYSELENRGVIYSVKGRGNFISSDCAGLRQRRLDEIAQQIAALARTARELGADEATLRTWLQGGEESK